MNCREWLHKNYDITTMEDENGALGVRKRAPAVFSAFGGGTTTEERFQRLSEALPSILAHMREEGVPGTKHSITQALHSIRFDKETKLAQDRLNFRHPERH